MLTHMQTEALSADTTWFHIFKGMIQSGDLASMGTTAFAVYAVIKSHTNFSTGRAFPNLHTIADKVGISDRHVRRELKILKNFGYLTHTKAGRKNVYTLREKVPIVDGDGRPTAVATWDYLPNSVQAAVAELRNVLLSGDLANARIIHIDQVMVNVQINQGTANSQQNIHIDFETIRDPDLKAQVMRAYEFSKTKAAI